MTMNGRFLRKKRPADHKKGGKGEKGGGDEEGLVDNEEEDLVSVLSNFSYLRRRQLEQGTIKEEVSLYV
jgi:hypothetical protein